MNKQELEIADKVLREMIQEAQKDFKDFPNSRLAKENLEAMYNVQSRITDRLEDKRVHGY